MSETSRTASSAACLECPDCGQTFDDRWRCTCASPLRFADRPMPDGRPPEVGALDSRAGLWTFERFLPVGNASSDRVTLGEGMTPLVSADAERAASETDEGWNAAFKLEYVFPTGSFKDRGAATTLTRAVELGVERVVEDSSGNAGAAIATYAARAGIDTEVYVPVDAKPSKLQAIQRAGATPVRIEGSRADVTDACVAAVAGGDDDTPAWYASHAWNPAFFEGTATVAYELAYQRDWEAPDAIVTPLGHGTLFLGAYWGFRRLRRAGWIDELPRLYGAQAAGVAPVVDALHGPAASDPSGTRNDAADGIQIEAPVRIDGIREAIADTGGDAVAITETAVTRELERLHAAGFYTEPTCAVAPAALRELRERGAIDADEDVVVPLTGSGLKT
ncbi:MAG: pyridoxal-phosphate dependent enzyme [Halorubrum sp.]